LDQKIENIKLNRKRFRENSLKIKTNNYHENDLNFDKEKIDLSVNEKNIGEANLDLNEDKLITEEKSEKSEKNSKLYY
jgi:hypothetical protein